MKATEFYNFHEIINNIKSGAIDQLNVITIERHQDDDTEEFIGCEDFIFAGTSVDDAIRTMNWACKYTKPQEGEMLRLFAARTSVTPEDFEGFDPAAIYPEDFIGEYLSERVDDLDNLGTDDWNTREIRNN